MSNSQRLETGEATSAEESQNRETQSLRFTPLRSYVSRARALAKQQRGEPALSRLIPVPRLQG